MYKWIRISACFAWLLIVNGVMAEEIRDYYAEPGLNPFKETVNQNFNESIDPFSGTLQLKYTDIVVPGNGGMDIQVNRSYTSLQTNKYPVNSKYGVGWVMHFGRIVASKSGKDLVCLQDLFQANTGDNPSLEHADGSRELLVLDMNRSDGTLVTRSNWRAKCIGDISGGLLVTAPDGTKYTMNQYDYYQEEPSWMTTRIEDVHGNWIRIEYTENAAHEQFFTAIYRSEEDASGGNFASPVVRFIYNDTGLLSSITANGQEWHYDYERITGYAIERYQLVRVRRPDGKTWEYGYNGRFTDPDPDDDVAEDGLASFSLNQVKYPDGAVIDYTYQYVFFEKGSLSRTTAIHTKTVSGSDIESGTTTYEFEPHSVAQKLSNPTTQIDVLYLDKTTVTTPTAVLVYYHVGKDFALYFDGDMNAVYVFFDPSTIGLMFWQETYELDGSLKEVISKHWGKRKISNENFQHGGGALWSDDATWAMYPEVEEVSRDSNASSVAGGSGVTQAVYYSNHDKFGNPGTITEFDIDGEVADKITTITYLNDETNWILGLPESEQVDHDGITAVITKQYVPGTSLVQELNEYGQITNYTYHPTGDLESVEDANRNITTYTNYKRGIAQQIDKPEGFSLYREVNDTGSLAAETDGKGYTKNYQYDDLNRLTGISYPVNLPVTMEYTGNQRILNRGNFRQTDTYDVLGQIISTERSDTQTGSSITQTTSYDNSGRVIFESYPNSNDGISFEYDSLDRITKKTYPDGNDYHYTYDDLDITETNERDNSTIYSYRSIGLNNRKIASIQQPENVATIIKRNYQGEIIQVFQGELQSDNSIVGYGRTFSYNDQFRLVEQTDIESGTTYYTYDAVGNKISSRTEGSPVTHYEYDKLNRLTLIDYPGETDDAVYDYDNNDNITTLTSGATQWGYSYDNNNNLEQETLTVDAVSPRTYSFQYQYDGLDTLSSITYPDNMVVDYSPDALGRATQVGSFATNLNFHPSGQLQSMTLGNGTQVTQTINNRMLPESIVAGSLVNLTYSYDAGGNVSTITDSIDSTLNVDMTNAGSYDGLDRIRMAGGAWGNATFNYDVMGNLTDKFTGSGSTTSYVYFNERLRKMTGIGGSSLFEYDVYGNVTYKNQIDSIGDYVRINSGKAFVYDDASRLISSDASEVVRAYTYDGNNQRTIDHSPDSYDFNFSVYSKDGKLLLEESVNDCSTTKYVRLGSLLIAKSEERPADVSQDTDADGIVDCLELQLGLDPSDASDAGGDLDGDGLTNIQEFELGTSLSLTDTDGDRVSDEDEVAAGISPNLADTDGDGLDDADESAYPGLDLTIADTDHDGVKDGVEIAEGLDPLDPRDGKLDRDGDGFSNRQEAFSGTEISNDVSMPVNGNILWNFQTNESIQYGAVVDANGIVYVASRDDNLYAINPDGSVKWSYSVGRAVFSSPAIGSDNTIYLNASGILYAVNEDGSLAWRLNVSGYSYTSPVVASDGTVYLITDSHLHAINSNGTLKWSVVHRYSSLYSSPAIAPDGSIYFGSNDRYLNAFSSGGRLKWRFQADNPVTSSPAIGRDGNIYFTTDNSGTLYSLSSDGESRWTYDYATNSGSSKYRSPVIGQNDEIYIGTSDGRVMAIDNQGVLLWENSEILGAAYTPSVGADGTIYTASISGEIYAIDSNGELSWKRDLGFSLVAPITIDTDGLLYVPSINGRLYALSGNSGGLAASSWPMFQHDISGSGGYCRVGLSYHSMVDDTDGDGVPDCVEILVGMDPNDAADGLLDPDSDGLTNAEEYANGSDSNLFDSDDDGLSDGDEVNVYGTSPIQADSDHDGLSDSQEINDGLDPLDASEGKLDSDNDGFSNRQEAFSGTDLNDQSSIPTEGQQLWLYETLGEINGSPAIDSQGNLYICSADGHLYSILPDGSMNWAYRIGDAANVTPSVGIDGVIYVDPGYGSFYAINSDGTLKWSFDTGSYLASYSSPAIAEDGTVYTGSNRGILYAIDTDGSSAWSYSVSGSIEYSPVIDSDGTIYFGTYYGSVFALNHDGSLKWSVDLGNRIVSSPGIGVDGTLYVRSYNGMLYSISSSGKTIWNFDTGTTSGGTPAIDVNGNVFVGGTGHLYILDADGTEVFDVVLNGSGRVESSITMGSDGNIYFGDSNGYFYSVDPLTGTTNWYRQVAESSIASTALIDSDGMILVGSADKKLYALAGVTAGIHSAGWSTDGHDAARSGHQCRAGSSYSSTTLDSDSDSLPNCDELVNGLDPQDATDAALDLDQDGLTNSEEYTLGTSYRNSDTDRDGLSDGDEANNWNTDPLNKDTDHDGLPDGYEVAIGFDPLVLNPASMDSDSDGFSDQQEGLAGTDPQDSSSIPQEGTQLWAFSPPERTLYPLSIGPDGTLYQPTHNGVYALYPDGAVKWKYSTTNRINASDGALPVVIGTDDVLYIDDISVVSAISTNGEEVWSVDLAEDIEAFVLAENILYVTTQDSLITVDMTGQVLWQVPLSNASYSINHSVHPVIGSDGTYYYVDEEVGSGRLNRLVALDASGNQKWSYSLPNYYSLSLTPALNNDGTVYLHTSQNGGNSRMFAFSPEGTVKWFSLVDTDLRSSPVIGTNGDVYVVSRNELLSIDRTGANNWSLSLAASGDLNTPVVAESGTIYISDTRNTVFAVDRSGTLIWSKNYGGYTGGSGSVHIGNNGIVYLPTGEDALLAIADNTGGLEDNSWSAPGRDIYWSSSLCRTAGTEHLSTSQDSDGDTIADCHEYLNGLDYQDGSDGILDADGDGLTNAEEYALGISYVQIDTDGDGLSDYDEVNIHSTNPNMSDTDADGLNDNYELSNSLNPLDPSEGLLDSDGDGFSNRQELLAGTGVLDSATAPASGTILWSYQVSDAVKSPPAIGRDRNIYFGSADGNLHSISPAGERRWAYPSGIIDDQAPVLNANDTVFVGSEQGFHAVDPDDGSMLWNIGTDIGFRKTTASASDGTLYTVSDGTDFTNRILYSLNSDGSTNWEVNLGSIDSAPSIAADGSIYIVVNDQLHSISPADGSINWVNDNGGVDWFSFQPVIREDGSILVHNHMASSISAIHSDGSHIWTYNPGTSGSGVTTPVVAPDGIIYYGNKGANTLVALTAAGEFIWEYDLGNYYMSAPAVAADGAIYIGAGSYVYAINSDGALKWRINLTRSGSYHVGASPVIDADGTVYIGDDLGNLYAIADNNGGLAASAWPMYGHDANHSGNASGVPVPANDPPQVSIVSPGDASEYIAGDSVSFSGSASDTEDGDLSASLNWSSDLDGVIGSGASFSLTTLSVGAHAISATVTDGDGDSDTQTISLIITSNTVDSDDDGMPDIWESANGLNPNDPSDRLLDGDADGFNNYLEYLARTDPADSSVKPQSQYYVLNPKQAGRSLSVVSLQDGNTISMGATSLNLDAFGAGSITASDVVQGGLITGTLPFSVGSPVDSTDLPVPASFAGTEFVIPHRRDSHLYYILSTEGDASLTVNTGAGDVAVTALQGEVLEIDAGSTNSIAGTIRSDLPVLVMHGGASASTVNHDVFPVPPAAKDLWGARRNGSVGALEDNTNVTVYSSDGATESFVLNANQYRVISIGNGAMEGADAVIHLLADKPIAAIQVADSDGWEATAYFDPAYFGNRHAVPVDTQYIEVICTQDTTIMLFDGASPVDAQACSSDGIYPGKVYFGSTTDGVNISAGAYVTSSAPIYLVYESSNADDEHNLLGGVIYSSNTQPVVSISEPATGSIFNQGDTVTFTGTAHDLQDGDISSDINWQSDIEGELGIGSSLIADLQSAGLHSILASVTDSGNNQVTTSISLTVNGLPSISIDSPISGVSVIEGESVLFMATASDSEDGDLSSAITWSSSLDNSLGTGASLNAVLSLGYHDVTATVSDSLGGQDNQQVTVNVLEATADTDSDGLPNAWEIANGLDPTDPGDRYVDSDIDGYNNFIEYQIGSDPGDNQSLPVTRYYVLNPVQAGHSINVVSLVDGNSITAGATNLSLDQYQSGTIPTDDVVQGVVVEGSGPFSIGSSTNSTDLPVPGIFAGNRFVIPHQRDTHWYYLFSPDGDATVEINSGSGAITVTVTQGSVYGHNAGAQNDLSGTIVSDRPILVMHGGTNSTNLNRDVYPVPPATLELWGARRNGRIGALEDSTTVKVYSSGMRTQTLTLDAGGRAVVSIGDGGAEGSDDVIHLVADKPIAAVEYADSDGYETTAYLDRVYFGKRYGIPVDAQYLEIVCAQSATVTLYDGASPAQTQSCTADGDYPGKVYFGSTTDGANIGAGAFVESDVPVYLIYEESTYNDEHNLLGH